MYNSIYNIVKLYKIAINIAMQKVIYLFHKETLIWPTLR